MKSDYMIDFILEQKENVTTVQMKAKRELHLWLTALPVLIPHSSRNLLLSPVICSYSHKRARFSFVAPCLWFPPYDLLWLLWLKEWNRNVSVPVLSVSLKKSCRFPPALPCFCHCHEKKSPRVLLPIQSRPQNKHTWSRATQLTYSSEIRSKVAQPTCRLLF